MRRVSVLLAALLFGAAAQACGPYRLAAVPYPGMYERDGGGRERGHTVLLVEALAERSGCKLELQADSVIRAWANLQEGRVDMLTAMVRNKERERLADFLVTLRSTPALLMRRGKAPAAASARKGLAAFEARPELRLVAVRGMAHPPAIASWLGRLHEAGRVSETGDLIAAMRIYEAGRVDAIVVHPLSLQDRDAAFWRQHELLNWFGRESVEAGFALSRQTVKPADRERLRAALQSLHQDGSLRRQLERSFGPQLAPLLELPPGRINARD